MATAAKTIDTKIINYLKVLNNKEKKAVLTVAETFAKESKQTTDFWDELSKEQKTAIDKAIKEADQGKLTSHKEVMKQLRRK
jgi:predicted transcriptional regulator